MCFSFLFFQASQLIPIYSLFPSAQTHTNDVLYSRYSFACTHIFTIYCLWPSIWERFLLAEENRLVFHSVWACLSLSYFGFCWCKSVFILLLLLKTIFTMYSVLLGCKLISSCLYRCCVEFCLPLLFCWKLAVGLIIAHLQLFCLFFLWLLLRFSFSLFVFLQFYCDMSSCVCLHIYLVWGL